jgi:MipA family protein
LKYTRLVTLLSALFTAGVAAAETPVAPPAPAASSPAVDTGPIPQPQRPLWELGLGASGLTLPDYRGSDQNHAYLLPFPYVVYRGAWLKSDRKGTRALLLDAREVEIDLSFGASVPTRSDTQAREGMPDLPGSIEVGPSLNIVLAESGRAGWTLDLRLPVRAAVSLERSPRYVGATFSPNLNLDFRAVASSPWNIGLLTGPLFANRRYHAQYYQVDPSYATAARRAYEAHGGYAGWQTLASTSRRWGPMWLAGFVRHESLHGSVYKDSPLVRRNSSLTVGFAVSWVLATSSQTVASDD